MVRFLKKYVSRIIMSILLLYSLNIMLDSVGFFIPINLITVGVSSFLGIPGLVMIIIIYFII